MTGDDIFNQTGNAYHCLIHPAQQGGVYSQAIARVISLARSVPEALIAAMIGGPSWRERLLGVCLGMSKQPANLIQPMQRSLQAPRAIAIVPTWAALVVLTRGGFLRMADSFAGKFDRAAFDGEMGWAEDKASYHAGLRPEPVPGRGPNYGQVFEEHLDFYTAITRTV